MGQLLVVCIFSIKSSTVLRFCVSVCTSGFFCDLSILVFSAQEEITQAISQKPRMKDTGLRKAQQVHRENVIHC